jgi:hypothetical protein
MFVNGKAVPETRVQIKVDDNIVRAEEVDYHLYSRGGGWKAYFPTDHLSFNDEDEPNVHKLTVRPLKFKPSDLVVVDCVVLIANKTK